MSNTKCVTPMEGILPRVALWRASREDVVAPARESFGLLEAAFNAGKLDLLSLSVAERQSFDAQMGYLDAWFNYAAAKTSLDLAVGEST